MNFSDWDKSMVLGYLIGFAALATLFALAMRIMKEQLSYPAQVGLFLVFLLIGALTSFYFYLGLPLFLLTRAREAYSPRDKSS